MIVANGIVHGHRHKHTGGLFAVLANMMHQVIGNDALGGIFLYVGKIPGPVRPAILACP